MKASDQYNNGEYFETALNKAQKRANKNKEIMYIAQDASGFYSIDELTRYEFLGDRQVVQEVRPGDEH